MSFHKTLEKLILGRPLNSLGHIPTHQQTVDKYAQQLLSKYPVRTVGYADTGEVLLTEEDREAHLHILGSPGEGKSKFIEYMLCQDIKNLMSGKSKAGACFIDSTGNGGTMKKVLAYCMKWGFEKVVVIDPHDIFKFNIVPPINPLDYEAPPEPIEAHILDSMRVLWQTKDFSDEAIIRKYLPRVIRALHSGKFTLPDAECFTIPEFQAQRIQICDNPDLDLPTRLTLQRVFRKIPSSDWIDFQSTARRLDPFFHSVMKLIFGSRKGLNFQTLITEGWVILVNLYHGGVYGVEHQRLLGTVIFNEIIRAIERLSGSGYKVPYYLYVDEFGHYATRKISDILDYRRHYKLRLTLAHQRFAQIEDPAVVSSVRGSAKNKLLFYTSNKADRDQMIKDMGYGGEIPLEQVSYVLGQTKKQEAVARIGKQPPVKMRLVDWPDAPTKNLNSFLAKIYTNPHYRPKSEVWGELKNRFVIQSSTPRPASAGSKAKPKTPNKTKPPSAVKPPGTTGKQSVEPHQQQNPPSSDGSEIFDSLANRTAVLRNQKGRHNSKEPKAPPPSK